MPAAASERITQDLIAKALANKHEVHPKDVAIVMSEIEDGSKVGDGYASVMYRVKVASKVRGEAKEDEFMVKCTPMTEHFENLMATVNNLFRITYLIKRETYLVWRVSERGAHVHQGPSQAECNGEGAWSEPYPSP